MTHLQCGFFNQLPAGYFVAIEFGNRLSDISISEVFRNYFKQISAYVAGIAINRLQLILVINFIIEVFKHSIYKL